MGSLMTFAEAAVVAQEAHHAMGMHEYCLMWSTLIVVTVLFVTALMARGQAGLVPRGVAAVYEHIFDWLEGIAVGFMGREGRNYVPLACSFFLFILMSNWLGLLPWPIFEEHGHELPLFESPTASISTTLALAVLSFLAFNLLGIKKRVFPPAGGHSPHEDHGSHDESAEAHAVEGGLVGLWDWIAHFWHPTPKLARDFQGVMKLMLIPLFVLFLGLNFVEEFARIASLSLRLYGNIFGEHAAKANMILTMDSMMGRGDAMGYGIALIVFGASCFVTLLGALAGFVQAMVFTMLTLSYIAHAVADEH